MINSAVLCFAIDGEQTEAIATGLKEAGFPARDISVLLPEKIATRGGATRKARASGLAWLLDAGQLTIPGLGLLIAGGPIMAAMVGAAVVGTARGGVTEALALLGMPEYQVRFYDQLFRQSHALICIHTASAKDAAAARDIFSCARARNILGIDSGYASAA